MKRINYGGGEMSRQAMECRQRAVSTGAAHVADTERAGYARSSYFTTLLFATILMLAPGALRAQTGTLTDDAYTSPNSKVQAGNLAGLGPLITVAGSHAVASGRSAGPGTDFSL